MNDFNELVRILNSGDDDLLVATFFTFPCTFTTPMGEMVFSTKEECVEALKSEQTVLRISVWPVYLTSEPKLHRVRECFQLLDYVYVPGKLFAKVDMIFPSTVESLDFHLGAVRPGDVLVVAILYAMVAGFNAQRFDVMGEYYTENAVVEYPPEQRFEGRKAIVDGFTSTAKVAKVELDLLGKICDESGLCLTFNETISAVADVQSLGNPIKAGDSFSRKIMVIITLEQGLIRKSKSILL